MRILCLGEIVGKPGATVIKSQLRKLKAKRHIDVTIANGEGMTNGFGLGKNHAIKLLKSGIDIITGGEKIFYKIDMVDFISKTGYVLRPANYPPNVPGKGIKYLEVGETKLAIINLLGLSDFPRLHLGNPFSLAQYMVDKAKESTPYILVQFHASTTAEKNTMGYLLAGKAGAVVGTHSKALTSDARILEGGTAFITDNGMCGSTLSVGGFEATNEIDQFITAVPRRSKECWDSLQLQGVIVTLGEDGKAEGIETLRTDVHEGSGSNDV
ncbi:MAG: YmdB family metallophosphoesterase [Spirochaetia bacterium]|nr:YmdB family metallophosphoesterase [Spirochaetia bacterium]